MKRLQGTQTTRKKMCMTTHDKWNGGVPQGWIDLDVLPDDEPEPVVTHPYLDADRMPSSIGDAMRLIGRWTESEGGNSLETRQARTNLFDAYLTWCELGRPEHPEHINRKETTA